MRQVKTHRFEILQNRLELIHKGIDWASMAIWSEIWEPMKRNVIVFLLQKNGEKWLGIAQYKLIMQENWVKTRNRERV